MLQLGREEKFVTWSEGQLLLLSALFGVILFVVVFFVVHAETSTLNMLSDLRGKSQRQGRS